MPQVEVTLADDTEMQIQQLVERDEFVDRQEAVEELLSMGIREHRTSVDDDEDEYAEFAEEMLETDQRSLGDEDDGYAF